MPRKKSELRIQLGPWIRYRGLTQHQVAKDAGVGDSYLTQLINNPAREPSVTVLFALAEALAIENPKDLFREPSPVKLSGAGQSEFAPANHSEVRAMRGGRPTARPSRNCPARWPSNESQGHAPSWMRGSMRALKLFIEAQGRFGRSARLGARARHCAIFTARSARKGD
jgi:transcriptional regulator with XRE-family HTH domain